MPDDPRDRTNYPTDYYPDDSRNRTPGDKSSNRTSHYGRAFSRADGDYSKYASALGLSDSTYPLHPESNGTGYDYSPSYSAGWADSNSGAIGEYNRRKREWEQYNDGWAANRNYRRAVGRDGN